MAVVLGCSSDKYITKQRKIQSHILTSSNMFTRIIDASAHLLAGIKNIQWVKNSLYFLK